MRAQIDNSKSKKLKKSAKEFLLYYCNRKLRYVAMLYWISLEAGNLRIDDRKQSFTLKPKVVIFEITRCPRPLLWHRNP
ncbi:unnamed protein product [Blepharisma stoltei]|uniref:Uncharacterized protein n=1 Tax=Blepharisma stoltei TaxID=1481888 RepID=A0AAU9IQH7_9CILI|nr:unnamed protein product [Blepharisma stoltei]